MRKNINLSTVFVMTLSLLVTDIVHAKKISKELCQKPEYDCYVVQRGDTWQKLFPDPAERDVVKRLNRINTKITPGKTIAVPKAYHTDHMAHSPFPYEITPPQHRTIIVSLSSLAFGAYDTDGHLKLWGPISGGRDYCPSIKRACRTPTGEFMIYAKGGPGCKSSKYPIGKGGAPMPYCMFFKGGYAIHGSPTVPGHHDSHGCVRLFTDDARWLREEFAAGHTVKVIVRK